MNDKKKYGHAGSRSYWNAWIPPKLLAKKFLAYSDGNDIEKFDPNSATASTGQVLTLRIDRMIALTIILLHRWTKAL